MAVLGLPSGLWGGNRETGCCINCLTGCKSASARGSRPGKAMYAGRTSPDLDRHPDYSGSPVVLEQAATILLVGERRQALKLCLEALGDLGCRHSGATETRAQTPFTGGESRRRDSRRDGAYSHAGCPLAVPVAPVSGSTPQAQGYAKGFDSPAASSRISILRKARRAAGGVIVEYHAITDDEIMQAVIYQRMAATYVIANMLRRKWKKLPTAYVRYRLRRLEAAGLVKTVPGYYAVQLSWSPAECCAAPDSA